MANTPTTTPARQATRTPRPLERRRYGPGRLLRANLYDLGLLLRESRVALSGFAVVLLLGVLYLHQRFGLGFARALYETLQMLIFQNSRPLPGDLLGALLFFLLPLLGLVLIVQSVLTFGRRLLDKGSRGEAWQVALASTYREQVILCGLGRVGLRVLTRLLEAGYDVVVVERDWRSRFVARALALRVPVIAGDAREATVLRQAGIARARALVAGINGDLLNIEIALAARTVRPELRVILRAFSEELDRNLERVFGPESTYSASALAAPTFAAAAVSRNVAYALPVGAAVLGISQVTLRKPDGGPLADSELEERHAVRVLHRQPDGQVTLLGTLAALEAVRREVADLGAAPLPLQHPTAEYDRVLVCGLGKVGYRVAQRLHAMKPRPRIVVIHREDDTESLAHHLIPLEGIETVVGDARDPAVLRRAGLEHAYAVAAVTADDLVNLQVALAARQVHPAVHVVVRVFSDALAEELNSVFEIHTTYSTSNLASGTLAAAAVLGGVRHAFAMRGSLFAADDLTLRVGDGLSGRTVADLRAAHGALGVELRRKGAPEAILLPPLDTPLAAGDTLTVVAPLEALGRLRRRAQVSGSA